MIYHILSVVNRDEYFVRQTTPTIAFEGVLKPL